MAAQRALWRVAIFLVVAGLGLPAAADELDERQWKLATSPNFRLHTVLPDERTIEMLRHLEVMRAAIDEPLAAATYQSAVPTQIIALDNEDDYRQIGAPPETLGIFVAGVRENAIFIQDTEALSGIRVILHEYVHYLHRKNGRVALPRWFEEGRAEYLSLSRINDDNFEYGLSAVDRLPGLTFEAWLPSAELISVIDTGELNEQQASAFYGQSWLLVHYLYSRAESDSEVLAMVAEYSAQVTDGLSKTDAFERAFRIKVEKLQMLLAEYLLANEFKSKSIALNTTLPGFAPEITALSTSDARLALARMAMRFQNDSEAERLYQSALSDEEARPYAEAGLGTVEGFRGNVSSARARFESAIHLVSYDFNIWMDYAQLWAQLLSQSTQRFDFEKREFYAERLEESLRNALTISNATPELNSLMGFSYLARGKEIDLAIEYLESAITESPIDQASRLLLADAYVMSGEFDRAIAMAEVVLSFEHDSNHLTVTAHNIINEARAHKEFNRRR